MRSREHITAEVSWLYRAFTLGPERILLDGETLRIEYDDTVLEISVGDVDAATVLTSWFWARLTIRLADGSERSIGGLGRTEAKRVCDAALAEAERVREAALAEVVRRAKELSPRLIRLDERLSQLFSGERYVRHDNPSHIHDDLVLTVQQCEEIVVEYLEQGAKAALGRLAPLESVQRFEAERKRANRRFTLHTIPSVQVAALPIPLTDEQAETIATDEEVTLILAGAGTGKTSVIVGKVAHLVRNEGVSPSDILVLAYNRKAADEIQGRLTGDLSRAHVHTFHRFGHRVIGDVERAKPTIAEESRLHGTLRDILSGLLDDPQQSDAMANLIASYHGAYESVFDFDTQDEYDAYIRSVELRTLSGARVKSFEELEIANYLTKHGVKFCYERPYEKPTQTREYRQYRPDFFLPDYNIYIEHHALDEWGRPPRGWKGYKERVEWHRCTHRKYGTKLIETYSWQHRKGILLDKLGERLEREGVRLERVSQRELVLKLARQLIEWLAWLLAKFLNHVKTNGLSPEELRTRASKQGTLWRNEGFLEIFEQVRAKYEQWLWTERKLDFHDLINRAAHYIRKGRWETPYRYVLVDEFQDISVGRLKLLQALRRDNTAYFLVGDDWQSINRFAGSDVGLVRNCGDYLGYVRKRALSKTFRFGDGILSPSTEFVRRNPEQTQRLLTSASEAEDKGITVVVADDAATGLQRTREDIEAYAQGKRHSVLVLGRYNSSKDALPGKLLGEEFSTVHGAKGREADYVVVLDLKDGRWGFPSRIEDNSLLKLVLPSASTYEFSEERRLFYVAMTRARIGAYLVTDPERPSVFVEELLRESGGDLRRLGELALPCPRCTQGRLLLFQSPRKLCCSNCKHSAPRCPNCNEGYALVSEGVAECSSEACEHPPAPCPGCGIGVLQKRDGKYGPFWGCTEYSAELPCRYTQNIEA